MRACMHACIHACMHTCMYVCMYVCMYEWMYVCVCVCVYDPVCGWIVWFWTRALGMMCPLRLTCLDLNPCPRNCVTLRCQSIVQNQTLDVYWVELFGFELDWCKFVPMVVLQWFVWTCWLSWWGKSSTSSFGDHRGEGAKTVQANASRRKWPHTDTMIVNLRVPRLKGQCPTIKGNTET